MSSHVKNNFSYVVKTLTIIFIKHIQVFDSIEKQPNGFLYGRTEYMGNFDECISARTTLFKGQHCMVNVYLSNKLNSISQGPGVRCIGNYNPLYILIVLVQQRIRLSYGLCLPSSCTATEIQDAIDQIDLPEGISVNVVEKNCWTDDPIILSNVDWIVMYENQISVHRNKCHNIIHIILKQNHDFSPTALSWEQL